MHMHLYATTLAGGEHKAWLQAGTRARNLALTCICAHDAATVGGLSKAQHQASTRARTTALARMPPH
jgi:uncharacterized protein YbjQ (UPF0145 family)